MGINLAGGVGGAAGGAKVGSMIAPGPGTLIGAGIGGLFGLLGGGPKGPSRAPGMFSMDSQLRKDMQGDIENEYASAINNPINLTMDGKKITSRLSLRDSHNLGRLAGTMFGPMNGATGMAQPGVGGAINQAAGMLDPNVLGLSQSEPEAADYEQPDMIGNYDNGSFYQQPDLV
jgi:hypothetical protein